MIPEFTAEAALTASGPYYMAVRTPAGGEAAISPQQERMRTVLGEALSVIQNAFSVN
jgi:hypothetical protein